MPARKFGRFDLILDSETSARLGRIRQKNTSAEQAVRQLVYALGSRYRISNRDLPGSPDLVNRGQKWAIFVHGCFWHAHHGCAKATVPKRNREFWLHKFAANRRRDAAAIEKLEALGYRTLVVWECELANPKALARDLKRFLPRGRP